MDYEKKYKEALERAKTFYENANANGLILKKWWVEQVFPELKESEDERIRNNCIHFLELQKTHHAATFEIDECIAWIEKQGQTFTKKDMGDAYLKGICDARSELEKQSKDKVEPKFKVGDWVVFNNKHQSIYQVEKIEDGYYILRHTHGGTFRVCVLHDESLRLWTIEDGKDGDVLACNEEILLFKSYSVQGRISLYCWYNGQTNNFHNKEVSDTSLTTRNKICPATKEQRDLLFQKMKDAGYEWDAEKKELKKIEQTPTDLPKGEDYGIDGLYHAISILEKTLGKVDGYQSDDGILEHKCAINAVKELYEQKPAWSEEDETKINRIVACLENLNVADNDILLKDINWLKDLKDRVQPKQEWSEEDEKMLRGIIDDFSDELDEWTDKEEIEIITNKISFLKSLKPHPIHVWSREDNRTRLEITDYLECQKREEPTRTDILNKWIAWIANLDPQGKQGPQWKPSELQLECLDDAIKHYQSKGYRPVILMELLEELKKLKG